LVLLASLVPSCATSAADDGSEKAVAVELFVSQGCDLCPKAEVLLGQLSEEFGPARVVPVAFHVDYFNDPWKDPYSNPLFSQREMQYSLLYTKANNISRKNYLYLTPLMMVDGRVPMVGSNEEAPTKSRAAIREALAKPALVGLVARFQPGSDSAQGELSVSLWPISATMAGKPVLVQAMVVEDGLATEVGSGELKGKTYPGRVVARRFEFQEVTLARRGTSDTRLSLSLEPGANAGKSSVVVFVQEEATGAILNARRVPWSGSDSARDTSRRNPER
jgi:hypothetical protein